MSETDVGFRIEADEMLPHAGGVSHEPALSVGSITGAHVTSRRWSSRPKPGPERA
ncbi:hypothetical protein [Cellulomonas cellasea]|uniref:Uncharacterized protein n=1 Tax=Cellulomonas cellasea TaxID=43670 RepID=A0A7W4UIP3_9CELL|nr:hypothetical protein [Cellulomonas cellasea]MBB2924529.1 hypothetical protein [Cellulomonas cellasea]